MSQQDEASVQHPSALLCVEDDFFPFKAVGPGKGQIWADPHILCSLLFSGAEVDLYVHHGLSIR